VPRSSRNFGLASDSSQNQRDGNRRVPDQDCTEGEGEFPTPCSLFFFQGQKSSLRPSVIVAQDDLSSDNLSFQSSPELHCALFQALLQLPPASHVSSLMISSTFLLGFSEAVRGRPLRDWSRMLVFPSFKCFTHRSTLLAPMHTSPYARWSLWWISAAGISSLTRNSMTAHWRNKTSLSAIFYYLFLVTWCMLLTPYLTQRYDNSWRHLPNDTQSFDVAELPTMRPCSWLTVWPSYKTILLTYSFLKQNTRTRINEYINTKWMEQTLWKQFLIRM